MASPNGPDGQDRAGSLQNVPRGPSAPNQGLGATDLPEAHVGPLLHAYQRFAAMEAAINVTASDDVPPEALAAADESIRIFADNAHTDMAILFQAVIQLGDRNDALKLALIGLVHRYAASDGRDREVGLYDAWMAGCAALDIALVPRSEQARLASMEMIV